MKENFQPSTFNFQLTNKKHFKLYIIYLYLSCIKFKLTYYV